MQLSPLPSHLVPLSQLLYLNDVTLYRAVILNRPIHHSDNPQSNKCTLIQALRLYTGRTAHRGSRGIALFFLDHGTRRGWGSASRPGRSLPPERPLRDNTQHSQQTNIHAPCGIRTHNLSRRAAVDLRLRRRGHWDRRH